MSRFPPHIYVIPEDDRDRQVAGGFVLHDQLDARRIQVMPPAGGWRYVLKAFQDEYIRRLRASPQDHVVMLIDFDGCYDDRRLEFAQAVPDDLKDRVFVVGPRQTPEKLSKELGKNYEAIGMSLAQDCYAGTTAIWGHAQLNHNDPDRQRLVQTIRPFLFKGAS